MIVHDDALVTLYLGDCVSVMSELPPDSVDAIVTDPPYNLGFMGKAWDSKHQHEPWAREAFRVAKPGAHLLAFGGTRTYHRLASAIEDAGWEIRDCLMWGYASGFPKSRNLNGDHKGWGTALKPAWEPIVMARKPLRGTVAANVQQYGTGALNIEATRIEAADDGPSRARPPSRLGSDTTYAQDEWTRTAIVTRQDTTGKGRWPANLVLSDPIFDGGVEGVVGGGDSLPKAGGPAGPDDGDTGTYSRFFLIPKSSRSDREPLVRGLPEQDGGSYDGNADTDGHRKIGAEPGKANRPRVNVHPTVKSLELMRHLVRLVTPPGGTVLDCFLGSGTTAIAANSEGFRAIGIEREAEYLEIAVARLAHQPLGMQL